MTIAEAIEHLGILKIFDAPDLREAVRMAITALREQQEREKPQPLTLEELRSMIGEPVWIVYPGLDPGHWSIVSETTFCTLGGYGEACIAYRYKSMICEDHTYGS